MKTLIAKLAASGCAGCPAKGPLAGQILHMNAHALVPSQRLLSETYDTGEVVLTTAGHGTFLIRRRKSSSANRCPLLDYEVCRIDPAELSSPTPDRPADISATRRTVRAACHELLELALARRV